MSFRSSARASGHVRRLVTAGLVLVVLMVLTPAPPGEGVVAPDITGIASNDQDIDPGETRTYNVAVTGYESGGTWVFSGTGLTVVDVRTRSLGVRLTITASATAEAGPRSLTVVNPDGLSDTFANAITVTGSNPPPTSGDVSGHVFEDLDGDGLLDAGEVGLEGVSVAVTDGLGTTTGFVTDASGDFLATGLPVGDATLVYTTPAGFSLTTGNATQVVSVVDGASVAAQDVGYVSIPTGTVTGRVFADVDGNGIEDGDDFGLPGISVEVTDAAGSMTTTTTDGSGDFTVTGLGVGDAQVEVIVASGYTLTTGNDLQIVTVEADTTTATAAVGYLPPEDNRPNFVVIVTDDQRWDTIGRCTPTFDGTDLDAGPDSCMPNLQQLLVAEGTTFLKGEVTQALCCPTRATLLTGQYSTTTGVTNNDGSRFDDVSTLATWLQDAGYRTGLFGKYLNGYGSGVLTEYIPPGWDSFHAFHGTTNQDNIYTDYPWIDWDAGGPAPVVTRYSDADSTSEAACDEGNYYSTDLTCNLSLQFLADDTTTPFMLFVGSPAPQSPNTPADRHAGTFSSVVLPNYPDYNIIPSPNPPSYLPTTPLTTRVLERAARYVRNMLETTLAVDDMIAEIHETLLADGRLANTVWIYMSDNGYAAGEHRLQTRSCAYLICHRVPFIVLCPPAVCPGGQPGAADSSQYALSIDIAPTIAELAGVTPGLAVEGQSLVPLIEDPNAPWRTEWYLHDAAPSLDGVVAEIGTTTYKYISRATGEKELYDLGADPWELTNLAGDSAYAAVEADLAARLAAHLG